MSLSPGALAAGAAAAGPAGTPNFQMYVMTKRTHRTTLCAAAQQPQLSGYDEAPVADMMLILSLVIPALSRSACCQGSTATEHCAYSTGRAIPAAQDKHTKAHFASGQAQECSVGHRAAVRQRRPGARGSGTHQNAMAQLTSRCSKPKRSLACCSARAPPLAAVTPSSVHWKFCLSSLSLQTGRAQFTLVGVSYIALACTPAASAAALKLSCAPLKVCKAANSAKPATG